MIRLALKGVADTEAISLAIRLRHVTVTESSDSIGTSVPEQCDAVVLHGREVISRTMIRECLRNRVAVLVSAEPGLSSQDLSELLATAQVAGVPLCIANPDRFLPSRRLISEQLAAGRLGELGLVRSHRWEPYSKSPGRGTSIPGPLIRDLDLTTWYFGRSAEVVYAVERTQSGNLGAMQIDERNPSLRGQLIQVHLAFSGGGMAVVDYNSRLPEGSSYQFLSAIGSAGLASSDSHRNTQLQFQGGLPRGISSDESLRGLTSLVQSFADALETGDELPANSSDWAASLKLAEAVRRSLDSYCAVTPGVR